jgi:hypothetical protein
MARERVRKSQSAAIERAAALVTEAMDLLDGHSASPEAAAHLAMAQQKLREGIGKQH